MPVRQAEYDALCVSKAFLELPLLPACAPCVPLMFVAAARCLCAMVHSGDGQHRNRSEPSPHGLLSAGVALGAPSLVIPLGCGRWAVQWCYMQGSGAGSALTIQQGLLCSDEDQGWLYKHINSGEQINLFVLK